jgi:hypothetical protein
LLPPRTFTPTLHKEEACPGIFCSNILIPFSTHVPANRVFMSSAAPPPQLLVIGLCGEPIVVNLLEQDTVRDVKCRAFAAASSTILDDKSRQSLVRGVTVEQLCLVHGMPEDAVKLDDASAIHHCLRHDLRLVANVGAFVCTPHILAATS